MLPNRSHNTIVSDRLADLRRVSVPEFSSPAVRRRPAVTGLLLLMLMCLSASPARTQEPVSQSSASGNDQPSAQDQPYHNELIRGQVVWLAEALQQDFEISTVPEVAEHVLAIRTASGDLIPLVENSRGRAFRKDPRLRNMQVELLVRRHHQQPFVQIIRIYEVNDEGQHLEVDYWCDICAITMYEPGPCSCCQADNRLRKQPVEDFDKAELLQ